MKKLLIVSFDLEVGGVERSLISLLNELKDAPYEIDLFLYRHTGEFMEFIPKHVNLLPEAQEYATFRKSIKEIFLERNFKFGQVRLAAKWNASMQKIYLSLNEPGYRQMQEMWLKSMRYLPDIQGDYDLAVSYLWPHYTVLNKVKAHKKAAWIHTDFSTVEVNLKRDKEMWQKFNSIVAVSESCKEAFVNVHPALKEKIIVIENMASPHSIELEAGKEISNEMDKGKFKIITVARLSYAKGIDLAVEAAGILKSKGRDDFTWYIVGYGGELDKLKKLVKDNDLEDHIIFLGKKINPYPFLKQAHLYVQPSRYEGKAVTVTEAQIMKLPVLITNYATAASQVHHGINGFITELSPKGIAKGIMLLKDNETLRTQLIKGCAEYDFSSAKHLDRFHSLVRGQI
ncbi:glycosyltransferase [Alkalicoccus daliensis]|uniref:Glycosyltransferase involved in cell wall bisynthesis n=1 Tax=Alkalicoccus daliensis TaxID=745820 RepID=A0A1G9ZL13_9BACI|nr:glycosyltransferase [Alkalicoccus daliensis]SDN21984.1 Glycosyltransferase involved in cell wall bisynthesis [Alkalicoccus daliensis]